MSQELTVSEKILRTAYLLEQEGVRPFSAEELVVAAWQAFPNTFGLRGHVDPQGRPLYPDSNRVFTEVMGSKPLRRRGLLGKVGSKSYQLTEAGRQLALSLGFEKTPTDPIRGPLPRNQEAQLRRLLGSRVLTRLHENRLEDVTFFDACSFWGLSPRSFASELAARFGDLEGLLERAGGALANGRAFFEHGGEGYSQPDLDAVRAAHEFLRDRFQQEIDIISARNDERA